MTVLAAAATIVGGLVSAVGAVQQGQAQAAAAKYQSQVAANNAIIARQNAEFERNRGQIESQKNDMKARALRATQEATQAASGFDINSGSLVDIRSSSAELGRLDTLTTANNAERRGRDFDIAASNADASSQLYSAQASNYQSAGMLNAFTSILGTASTVGDKWNSWKL